MLVIGVVAALWQTVPATGSDNRVASADAPLPVSPDGRRAYMLDATLLANKRARAAEVAALGVLSVQYYRSRFLETCPSLTSDRP
jgi:hypothetical protein